MIRTLVVSIGLLAVAGIANAQVLISTCGAVVPPKGIGILQNDLDCGDLGGFCPLDCGSYSCAVGPACQLPTDCEIGVCNPVPAVVLGAGAQLDMAGHSISAPGTSAVQCGWFQEGKGCKVFSSVDHGEIKDSDIGIAGGRGPLTVTDVEVQNCRAGIQTIGKLTVTNVSSDGNNNFGYWGKDIVARNVSADDNLGFGLMAGVSANGKNLGGKIRGVDVSASGNGQAGAFAAGSFTIVDLDATGNGFAIGGPQSGGIVGLKGGHLIDSTVTGNVNGPAHDPLDVYVAKKPHLVDTTCGTSGQYPNKAVGWGVCSND